MADDDGTGGVKAAMIPTTAVVAVIAALTGGGSLYSQGGVADSVKTIEADHKALDRRVDEMDTRMAGGASTLEGVKEDVGEINSKLDRVLDAQQRQQPQPPPYYPPPYPRHPNTGHGAPGQAQPGYYPPPYPNQPRPAHPQEAP